MATQGVIGERTGPNARLGVRGAAKGALPGTVARFSEKEKGADPRGVPTFQRRFPPSVYFFVASGVSKVCKAVVFRGWNIIVSRGYYFRIPGVFGSAAERPTLYPQVRA